MSQVKDHAGFYTSEKLGETRSVTPEGFLVCHGVPIARTGEQLYGKNELDGLEANGSGYIVVKRPAEEVFRDETLASFEGKPVTVNHPNEGVNSENWKKLAVGHVQNVRRGEGIEDDLILGDLLITEADAIAYLNEQVDKGSPPEVSSGYSSDYDQGEAGHAIQRNIVGNHVAMLVGARGRAGPRVAFRDSTTDGENDMATKFTERKFWRALRVGLNGLGVKTADADALEQSLEATIDGEGAGDDPVMKKLESMDAQLKSLDARMNARDAEEAEEKKEEEEAAAKKKAEDEESAAAEAAARKAAEDEAGEGMEEEATGDTIIEAEEIGHVITLGKVWTGTTMTGDAASQEPVLQAVLARAEVLAPGLTGQPTADSIKGNKGKVLSDFMRRAIETHATADAVGAANVKTFLMGKKVGDLRGANLVGVFNGVAQLARVRNNQSAVRAVTQRGRMTGDFAQPKSIQDINKTNAEFWAKRQA